MYEKLITTKVEVLTFDELNPTEQNLVTQAKEATSRAYAPYSHFHVGAALQLENGKVLTGSNQENAAFPSSLCAERSVIYYANANYPGVKFNALAIAAFTKGEFLSEPISPCGSCRQAILEYEVLAGRPIKIILCAKDAYYRINGIKELLPLCFSEF